MLWLLHGNMGLPNDWQPLEHALSPRNITCRAINLWRYLQCCPKSLPDMGQLLCAQIMAQDPAPVICGYSMGARLAMHAVLAQPSLWHAAVFVSGNPGLLTEQERANRRMVDARWAVMCKCSPWQEFTYAWNTQPVFAADTPSPPAHTQRLLPWRNQIARAFIDWSLGAQANLYRALQKSPVPCLWVAGELDSKFAAIARNMAGPRARIIPGTGHRIPMTAPDKLATILAGLFNA